MRMLIVEDDLNKFAQLANFLSIENDGYTVSHSQSLQSGLRKIKTEKFDVVLLDMTLPVYDLSPDEPDNRVEPFGGLEFLRNMRRFQVHIPVIVFTQFEYFSAGGSLVTLEDLAGRLQRDYPQNYKGMIYYHASIDEWKQSLLSALANARTNTHD